MKTRKILSVLLTFVLALGVIAIAPVMANAADIHDVCDATELAAALAGPWTDGDIIKLEADITYTDLIFIDGKTITFDLNGKILDVVNASINTYAFTVSNGGQVLLKDPTNGQLNITGTHGLNASGSGKVEVTNVTATSTSTNGCGIITNTASTVITVYGNVSITSGVSASYGVRASNGSQVTVEGTVTVQPGMIYIQVGFQDKTQTQYEATSSNLGYFEYKGTNSLYSTMFG